MDQGNKRRGNAKREEATTIEEAARRLGIGRNQAYQAATRGELPAIRIGRRWIVPTAALNRILESA
jgi:excisionase family DNA binding protein